MDPCIVCYIWWQWCRYSIDSEAVQHSYAFAELAIPKVWCNQNWLHSMHVTCNCHQTSGTVHQAIDRSKDDYFYSTLQTNLEIRNFPLLQCQTQQSHKPRPPCKSHAIAITLWFWSSNSEIRLQGWVGIFIAHHFFNQWLDAQYLASAYNLLPMCKSHARNAINWDLSTIRTCKLSKGTRVSYLLWYRPIHIWWQWCRYSMEPAVVSVMLTIMWVRLDELN